MLQKVINIVYSHIIMSFCPACGTKNEPNTAFCSNCGTLKMPTAMPFSSSNTNFTGIRLSKTTVVVGLILFSFYLLINIYARLVDSSIQGYVYLIGFPLLFLAGITYLFFWGLFMQFKY